MAICNDRFATYRNGVSWIVPTRPAYFHRLAEAVAAFRRLPSEWIDRRTAEETLGVSKTVAWRILRRCGAEAGPGNTLVCRRENLIAALERLQEDSRYRQEVHRRQRLESRLGQLLAAARSQHVQLAPASDAAEMVSSRFAKLPPEIELKPRELTMKFDDSADFLRKIGAVVFALQNDYEAIRDYIDSAADVSELNK
jgi:hypothetical protein